MDAENSVQAMTVWENIRRVYDQLSATEKKAADTILQKPEKVLGANVSNMAELCDISEATVVRVCKHIGYSGFSQLKIFLSRDMGVSAGMIRMDPAENTTKESRPIMEITRNLSSMAEHLDMNRVKACADHINRSSTVYVIGNGYNKLIAADMIYRLTRKGIRCSGGGYSETDYENLNLGVPGDVAVFFSRSGEDKKAYDEIRFAKEKGIITISITDAVRCPMSGLADHSLTTGIPMRSHKLIQDNSSSLYMAMLVEILLSFVDARKENTDYLEMVVAADRL